MIYSIALALFHVLSPLPPSFTHAAQAQHAMAVVGVAAAAAAAYATWRVADERLLLTHDLDAMRVVRHAMAETMRQSLTPGFCLAELWSLTLAGRTRGGTKPALVQAETGKTLTAADVEALSNRVARWAAAQGLAPDSTVAVVMENSVLYVPIVLGLTKAGLRVAMVNSHATGHALTHSVAILPNCGALLCTSGRCAQAVRADAAALRDSGVLAVRAVLPLAEAEGAAAAAAEEGEVDAEDGPNLLRALEGFSGDALTAEEVKVRRGHVKSVQNVFGYIYTSGTTGLPKACVMTHLRFMKFSCSMPTFGGTADDVVYGSGLPLYHSAAWLGVSHLLRAGSTYIVRRRFSASRHFEECAAYKATIMQYIGELCRYLLSRHPPSGPAPARHSLRLAVGNGLRPEIWDAFQRRCGVCEIGEFYGATEGNGSTANYCRNYRGQGAVGVQGWLARRAAAAARGGTPDPLFVARYDVEEDALVRDGKTGLVLPAAPNTPGELLVEILQENFNGYTSTKESDKKVVRGVRVEGDAFFRTGDLLRQDGYRLYFVDRLGDTFRWKGENVSTMEVSEVLSRYAGVVEACVYGVVVPGTDGRAGMAALRLREGVAADPVKLAAYCRENLPSYAVCSLTWRLFSFVFFCVVVVVVLKESRSTHANPQHTRQIPLFIRFLQETDLTGTFKHMKVQYKKDGFDPAKITDPMWYYDAAAKTYTQLDGPAFTRFQSAQAKL